MKKNNNKMAMFTTAKAGDNVYSLKYGNGTIYEITKGDGYPICVIFPGCAETFSLNGYINKSDATQDLYWSKPEIIAPSKPKRLVEVVENIFINKWTGEGYACYAYRTKKEACADAYGCAEPKLKAVPAKLIYTIEED